jgi:dynein heavy chain
MLFASPKNVTSPQDLVRLYVHEAERTYSDKLVNQDDIELFNKILRETIRKSFEVNSYFSNLSIIIPLLVCK